MKKTLYLLIASVLFFANISVASAVPIIGTIYGNKIDVSIGDSNTTSTIPPSTEIIGDEIDDVELIELDHTAPVITILGSNPVSVYKGSTYTDAAAKAIDETDKNVNLVTTGSVNTSVVGTYTITYTATDSAGNTSAKTRTVNVINNNIIGDEIDDVELIELDHTAPVITILGSNPVSVYKGSTYTDAAAKAIDETDKNVNLVTTGSVNTSVVGTYTITYTATDSAGNTSAKTRTVNVIKTSSTGGGGGGFPFWLFNNKPTQQVLGEKISNDISYTNGKWVKTSDRKTVYFVDIKNTRHAYPNQNIWESYFGKDFSFVKTISKEELASYPLEENVPYNRNSLFKISSIPKVYRVSENATIHWIETEDLARRLYGINWNKKVQDLSDAFFGDYNVVEDTDGDGLHDIDEITYGTNPNNQDTDGDGYFDGEETIYGYSPIFSSVVKK